MLRAPSIVSASPPTSPITRAAAPNALIASAGPETTKAPGASPKRSSRPQTVAPRPPASAHSASATATPPSATSCAERIVPALTAWRTAACSALSSPSSGAGSGPATPSPRRLAGSEAAAGGDRLGPAEGGRRGRPAARLAAQLGQLRGGGARRPRGRGDQRDGVARPLEAEPAGAPRVRQLAHEADDGRRVDRALGALVVEADVAADDRDPEGAAGVSEARHRARELPGDVRLLGVAEVQAVGQAERLRADAGEVRAALEHGLDRAAIRVGGNA